MIFHKNSEISEAAKQEKTKEELLSALQSMRPRSNVCIFMQALCVCVCVCGSAGEVLSCTNKLEPIDTQSSVMFSSVATVETSYFLPSKSSAGILLLCFE